MSAFMLLSSAIRFGESWCSSFFIEVLYLVLHRMRKYLALFLLIFSAKSSAQSAVDLFISSVEAAMGKQAVLLPGAAISNKTIGELMKDEAVNGVSIAVINNDKIEWAKAYGIADKSKNDPVTTSTLFQCASIGKTITAMAALHLVKQGKLELDEDVNNKLTRWKLTENDFTKQKKVTLRWLLSHSAGLTDDYGFFGYPPGAAIPTLLQLLNNEPPATNTKKLVVQTVPGTTERYSGGGYLIIQELIEEITDQSFSSYVQAIIFDPLNMVNTTYAYYPDLSGKQIARGHDKNGRIDKKVKYHVYPEMAAAGPWTTPTDLAKLIIEIQKEYRGVSDLVINQQLCSEMLIPQINFKGLGVHLTGAEKPEAFWHAGNSEGFTGLYYGIIHSGQGAVVLTNSDQGEEVVLQVVTGIATVYNWPVMKIYQAQQLTANETQSYKGHYQTAKGLTVEIGEIENGLFLRPAPAEKKLLLYKIGDGVFTLQRSPDFVKLIFNRENGTIISFTIVQNLGKTDTFKKLE